MNIKTEFNCAYNEDNFVQNGDSMQEITVTITLCEYRNIIEERIRNEQRIERLEQELKNAKETGKNIMTLFMTKSPETLEKFCDVCKEIFPQTKDEAENGETDNGES